ncbi:hypothetical protein [Pseudoteredinibacter isoporae]|uniref:hypothetical protein n=1 Tax=Pseudoteredinibacter isoporae TaxID=570281 RepID=UPI003106349F
MEIVSHQKLFKSIFSLSLYFCQKIILVLSGPIQAPENLGGAMNKTVACLSLERIKVLPALGVSAK